MLSGHGCCCPMGPPYQQQAVMGNCCCSGGYAAHPTITTTPYYYAANAYRPQQADLSNHVVVLSPQLNTSNLVGGSAFGNTNNPHNLSVAGNSSVVFANDNGGAARRRAASASNASKKIGLRGSSSARQGAPSVVVTSNTACEASAGRYVLTEPNGQQSVVAVNGGAAGTSGEAAPLCYACGQTSPPRSGGGGHVDPYHQHQYASVADTRQLAGSIMQSLGYSADGRGQHNTIMATTPTSPIRQPPMHVHSAPTTQHGYVAEAYRADSGVFTAEEEGIGGAPSQRGATASPHRASSAGRQQAKGGYSEEAFSGIRGRVADALGGGGSSQHVGASMHSAGGGDGLDPRALRHFLSVAQNKGQLSDEERARVFAAAGVAAAGAGSNASSSGAGGGGGSSSSAVRSRYANVVHAAERNSGAPMLDSSAVLDRIGQHMHNAFDNATARRLRDASSSSSAPNAVHNNNSHHRKGGDIYYAAMGEGVSGVGGGLMPRSASRGKAAGHTHRDNIRSSSRVGVLPPSRLAVTHNSSTVRSQSAAARANNHYNPLVLGTAVLGCRGLAGAKGDSSLAPGSCVIEGGRGTISAGNGGSGVARPATSSIPTRRDLVPSSSSRRMVAQQSTAGAGGVSASQAVPTQRRHVTAASAAGPTAGPQRQHKGRARSADAPKDNIRSVHYTDGIRDVPVKPSGVRITGN